MTAGLNKTDCIRELVAQRLKAVAASELSNAPAAPHLDEDTIAAFVEGRLTGDECTPVVSHLAACGICRRTSAQFVQLQNQIDDEIAPGVAEEEPGRLEGLLSRLRTAVPSGGEEVVFAYENPKSEESKDEASKEGEPET